jgi:uncharacterized repeat protein (TIGR01451 family)
MLCCVLLMAACGGGSGRRGTDVVVTGTGPSAQVLGGTSAVFVMTVSNAGPDAASNVKINNLVGNQLALTSITCSAGGGAVCPDTVGVTMVVPSLPTGGTLVFTVTTLASPNATGTIANSMSAQVDGDLDSSNNQFTATAPAYTVTSNLVVSGSGPTGSVTGGATADFLMVVTNAGPDAAANVRIVNNVGTGLSLNGVTCTASGGAVCPATGPVMSLLSMPAGGVLTFDVSTTVGASVNGTVVNTLSVSADTDNARSDNSFAATANVVTARSGVFVTAIGPAADVPGGTSAIFRMTVGNAGPQAADTLHLVNTVGGNMTLTSITCTASGGAVCPDPAAVGVVTDATNLPVDGSLEFDVTATVAAGTQGVIVNTLDASVTSGVHSTASGVATGNAYSNNISVSGSPPTGPLAGGSTAFFTMVVSNSGPGTAQNVSITNVLNGVDPGPGPITCAPTNLCPVAPAATMTVPSLPANTSVTFVIPVVVRAGANGTVSDTMTATAAGDVRANDNSATASVSAVSIDLGVSETGAPSITAGSTAVFTALVNNPGTSAVNNLTVNFGLSGADPSTAVITCTVSGGGACPSTAPTVGAAYQVPSLAAGRTLTFTITVPVVSSGGTIVSTTSVAAAGDPNTANNQASFSTATVDARSGTYKLFAANGQTYDMVINFDTGSYTVSGGAQTPTAFTAGSNSEFVVTGSASPGARFRVATDLIVGGHDFGGGVQPYVAARSFGSAPTDATGQFNLATRDTPTAGGAAVTRPGTAVVTTDGTLFLCQLGTGTLRPVTNCGGTGGVTVTAPSYSLSVDSNFLYTATPLSPGLAYQFYLVRSGPSKILISAGGAQDSVGNPIARFRIGVQDLVGLAGGTLSGATTTGDWVTLTLSSTNYASSGVLGGAVSAPLQQIANSGTTAVLTGQRSSDLQLIDVMQAGPLAVVFGAFSGGASGLLQIAVPVPSP